MPPSLSANWNQEDNYGPWLRPPRKALRRLVLHPTGAEATPSPIDIGPAGLVDQPTGQLTVVEPPEAVVRKAVRFIRAMAVLPVDPEADKRIDRLVAKRLENELVVPLTREV